jgi:hypothetical protein
MEKMTSKELKEMKQIHDSLASADDDIPELRVKKFNPHEDIETTLTEFLKTRLKKLESDQMFELAIKNNLMTRISEANIPQLINLLDLTQKNANSGTMTLLTPFISQAGEKTLLDRHKIVEAGQASEEEMFNSAGKDVLQGLDQLKQLLTVIDENNQSKKDQSTKE